MVLLKSGRILGREKARRYLGYLAPDDVADIRWPSRSVNAGRKESRVDEVKMIRWESEISIQVVNLCLGLLATVFPLANLHLTLHSTETISVHVFFASKSDRILEVQ